VLAVNSDIPFSAGGRLQSSSLTEDPAESREGAQRRDSGRAGPRHRKERAMVLKRGVQVLRIDNLAQAILALGHLLTLDARRCGRRTSRLTNRPQLRTQIRRPGVPELGDEVPATDPCSNQSRQGASSSCSATSS
jgi:hypothetical protein